MNPTTHMPNDISHLYTKLIPHRAEDEQSMKRGVLEAVYQLPSRTLYM